MTTVEALTGGAVDVPRSAGAFARQAADAGWGVRITTTQGQGLDAEFQPLFHTYMAPRSAEDGSGNRRVTTGTPKVVETVVVRCRRRDDYLIAVWTDGKFDFAGRPWAMRQMSSRQVIQHVTESHTWPCRWLPSSRRGMQVCDNHGESREAQ